MGDRSIREAILQITNGLHTAAVYALDATVESVDEAARTCVCQVITGKASNVLTGVRLMAAADDGLLLVPTVGSNVCIILIDGGTPYISQYSEIDKIVLRGGDLGGLVKVIDLTKKLNALENKVNDIIAKYDSHTHPVVSTGAPTGPVSAQVTGSLPVTDRADIENIQILQG